MATPKKKLEPTGEILELPVCDYSDPADLAAWYGNFGYDEKYREVRLANAKELVRAKAALLEASVTEERIKDLGKQEQTYLDYLAYNLIGRKLYEKEKRQADAKR